jgi:hypothetical protein
MSYGDGTAALEQASAEYVGRWNRLVSTTNWEKGRIIHQWRSALADDGAPASACSDDAWSRTVGGVSAQHVGRLRRVFERFGQTHDQFTGLYWSHFFAALDWDDAEMWLEGAIQNEWSVPQMRRQRWETLDGLPDQEPSAADTVSCELDEDVVLSAEPAGPAPHSPPARDTTERPLSGGVRSEEDAALLDAPEAEAWDSPYLEPTPSEPVRPFAGLAELPADLSEAFEAYKLAILRHKAEGWQAISRDELLASLDALKELALAPSVDPARPPRR